MFGKIKELFTDSVFYGLSTIIGQLAGLILVPFFTKEFIPSEYGLLNMVSLVVIFLSPVAGLAMDTALFRFFSLEHDENEKRILFSTASIVKTTTVLLISFSLIPFYSIINNGLFEGMLTPVILYLILASFVFENFSSLSFVILRSERKVKLIALNSIIYVFASIIFSVYFVLILHWGVQGSLIGGVLASILKIMLYMRVNKRIFSFSYFSKTKAIEMLKYSLPMLPHKIQSNIIGLFTTFMINQKLGLVYSGYYAVASKVAKPLVFIVTIVQQSWTPYRYHIHKTENQPSKTFSEIIGFYWIFLFFLWAIMGLLTPFIFSFLINKRYESAQPYVPFIMFVSIAQAFFFTITTGFELKNDQRRMVLASFYGMSFLVVVSLLTINLFQPYTFFIIQAISFFVLSAVIFPEARKIINIYYPFLKISIFFIITTIILIIAYKSNNQLLNILLFLPLFVVTALMFKWIFPQYPLNKILYKVKNLRVFNTK